MLKPNCKFCNKKLGVKTIVDHMSECIPNYINEKSGYLIEFLAESYITNKKYQMIAIFGNKCKFTHIDKFLRKKWCECCSHMSTLEVYEEVNEQQTQKSVKFNTLISKYEKVNQFLYNYDMGSTTTIYFRILKKLEGKNNNTNIELLYRNEPYKIKCKNYKNCKGNANYISEGYKFCHECKNNLEEPEYILNLSNSPRTGICGYENDNIEINYDEKYSHKTGFWVATSSTKLDIS